VAERDRTDDADIEFDFFDEPATAEHTGAGTEPRATRGGGPPVRPRAPGSGTPLPRLVFLIAAAIVLAVVLVFWVSSCREGGQRDSYRDYLNGVGQVVASAQGVGEQLAEVLTTPGATLEDVEAQLDGLARQQGQAVARADALTPPGGLVAEQQSLVEAMQLLESGLAGLARAFGQIQLASDPEAEGQTLAGQAGRLVAGQVVYDDLFRARAQEAMRLEDVTGVAVPELTFLQNAELTSQDSLAELVARLVQDGGGGGGGGLHGNQVDGVRVQPSDETLSPDQENTIVASDRLAIQVLVTNSGDFQESQVRVTLTIQQSGEPIRKQQTIDAINSQETKIVTFRNFTDVVLAAQTTLQAAVRPVESETNTANNTAEYTVIFTLE